MQFLADVFVTCEVCQGSRFQDSVLSVRYLGKNVDGKTIHQLTAMTASELLAFFTAAKFEKRLSAVVQPVLKELKSRLELVTSIGLDYLPLDRDAGTLSGGEAQRLRLAKALGSPLSGVCYILDEPSIGLHPQDHDQLLQTLYELRDRGNTVLIVEHDEDTIRAADHIIDVGPHGGTDGGSIVYTGTVAGIEACEESLTGQALAERSRSLPFAAKTTAPKALIELSSASANTLRNVDVEFPHQQLSVICGVSGAGKSSLIHGSLVPAIVECFEGEDERAKFYDKTWGELSGLDSIERFVEIDQSPIGKTRTSTPLSYLKIFDLIRKAYAATNEAKTRGWTASHFSYNTGKGRCDDCGGRGSIVVPMSFLPDAETPCETCDCLRYNEETLLVEYQGFSLGALMQLTFDEVYEVFKNHSKIERSLKYVLDLGLGYLGVGQPTYTLSGGEAQRIKIAKELGLREAKNTLYILDEPTIGLHMTDVEKLRNVLSRLIDAGNTVIVIEHNMDIIRSADHLIEMGPGPGEAGGRVLFQGAPKKLALRKKGSPTQSFLAQGVEPAKRANS
ncbi:UNVERIFIED_CONTAM: hypothetical protein GTU68_021931 [Idotea baltica]|nr:hypothetical protein [Idotea baltica]